MHGPVDDVSIDRCISNGQFQWFKTGPSPSRPNKNLYPYLLATIGFQELSPGSGRYAYHPTAANLDDRLALLSADPEVKTFGLLQYHHVERCNVAGDGDLVIIRIGPRGPACILGLWIALIAF
jgi:hypothetical protein